MLALIIILFKYGTIKSCQHCYCKHNLGGDAIAILGKEGKKE